MGEIILFLEYRDTFSAEFYSESKKSNKPYCHFTALKNEAGARKKGSGRRKRDGGVRVIHICHPW